MHVVCRLIFVPVLTFLFLAASVSAQAPLSGAGNLQIRCVERAAVSVDGKPAGTCKAKGESFLVSNLAAGRHTVGVRRSGYVPGQAAVTIQAGTTADLNLAALKLRRRIKYRPQEEPVDMTVESPPMFSDDTGTPGDRNVELNLSLAGDLSHDRKEYELPLLDLNYGVGETLQLKYEVPWVFARTLETDAAGDEHTVRAHGIGNSVFGVKDRFYDDDETRLSLAVYPQVELRSPGSKREEDGGVSARGTTWILPLLLTKEFERAAFTGNLGVEKSSGESGSLFASAGLGTRLDPHLALLGEIAGEDLNHSGSRRLLVNVGVRKKLDDHQTVGAAVGHDFHAGDGQHHTYVRFSYQRYFGDK